MKLIAAWYDPLTDRYRMEYAYLAEKEMCGVTGWAEYYMGKTNIPVLPVTHHAKHGNSRGEDR